MAQKVQVLLVDDLDGSEAHRTVRFGIDGTGYEIDLNPINERVLRKLFEKYISNGRKVTTKPRRDRSRDGHSAQVRAWANGQGLKPGTHGRIPADVIARYEAAHR